MFHHIRTAKNICTSQHGNVNVLTAGGVACLALDAAYVILADEVKIPIAVVLAAAGIAGIATGVMSSTANSRHRTSRPAHATVASQSRQTESTTSAAQVAQKTTSVTPKPAAYTTGEIDDVMNVLTKLSAVYKYL